MNLLLSERMPLRTTKVFGTFAEESVLPHHYGDLSTAPVPLVKLTSTTFLVADHPIVRLVGVQIDDVEISGYAYSVETDPTGHAYAQVALGAPLPDGSSISATLLGKFNPKTGGLMNLSADIVEDMFAFAGKSDKVPQLRVETAGLKVAGSLTQALSIRASLDLVTRSIGAIWTSGMAKVYPAPPPNQLGLVELNFSNSSTPVLESQLADTSDSLQVNFDYCEARQEFLQSITLKASPTPFGGPNTTVAWPESEAGWIRQVADAEALGRRLLGRLATEKVSVTLETSEVSIQPGQWVMLNHPSFPADGPQYMMVLGVSLYPFKGGASITGEVVYGLPPTITIVRVSKAAASVSSSGVAVAYANGTATFTILDPDGKPLMGAQVSLDRGASKRTDAKGQVSFITSPGTHTLGVQADGYVPVELTVTV